MGLDIGRNTLSQEIEDEEQQKTIGNISHDWEEEEDYEDVTVMPPPHKRHTPEQQATPKRSSATSSSPRLPRRFLTTSRRRTKESKNRRESSSDEGDKASQVLGGRKPLTSSRGLNLTASQERDVVEWYQDNELFYKKKLRCYKDTAKKGRLLAEKAAELDINGE